MAEPLGVGESVQLTDADAASNDDTDDDTESVNLNGLTQDGDGSSVASAAPIAASPRDAEGVVGPPRSRHRAPLAVANVADFLPMVPNKPMDDVEAVVLDTLRGSEWRHLYLMRIYPINKEKRDATETVIHSKSYMHKWALFAASSARGLPSFCPFVVYRMTVSRREAGPEDAETFAAVAHHQAVFEIVRVVGWTRLKANIEAVTTQLTWIYAHRTLKRANLRSYIAPGNEESPTWAAEALLLYNDDGATFPDNKAVQLALRYDTKIGAALKAFSKALPALAAKTWNCTRTDGDKSNPITFRPTMMDPPPRRHPDEMAAWRTFKRCMVDTHYFADYFNAFMALGVHFGGAAIAAYCTDCAFNPGDVIRRGNLEERLSILAALAAEQPALLLYDGSILPGAPPSAEDIRLFQTYLMRFATLRAAFGLGGQVYRPNAAEALAALARSLATFRRATAATRSTWAAAPRDNNDRTGGDGGFVVLESGARIQVNPYFMNAECLVHHWIRTHVPSLDPPLTGVPLFDYIQQGGRLIVVDTAFQAQFLEQEMPRSMSRMGVQRFCIAAPSANEINYVRQSPNTVWNVMAPMWHDLSSPDGLRDSLTDPPTSTASNKELTALIVMYTESFGIGRAAALLRRIPPRAHSIVVFVGNSAIAPLRGEHGSFFQALMACPWARCLRVKSATATLLTETMRFGALLCAGNFDDARDFVRDLPTDVDEGAPIAARTVDDLVAHLRKFETQRAGGSLLIAAPGPQTTYGLAGALLDEERRRGQIAAGEWITVRRRQRGGICDPPVAYWCTHLMEHGTTSRTAPGLRWPGECAEVGLRGVGDALTTVVPALFDIEPLLVADAGRVILPFVRTIVIVVTPAEPWASGDLIYAMSRATDQIIFVRDGVAAAAAMAANHDAPPRDINDFMIPRVAGSTVLEESRWSMRVFVPETSFTSS